MKKKMKKTSLITALLMVLCVFGCDRKATDEPNKNSEQQQGELIEETSDSTKLNEALAQELIENAIAAYTSIEANIVEENKVMNNKTLYLLNSSETPNIEALQLRLNDYFSTNTTQTILNYYCATQDAKGVFVCSHSDDDVNSLFEDFNVRGVKFKGGNNAEADLELQIGESGQTDSRVVQFVKNNNKWLLDSNPFVSNDNVETGNQDSSNSKIN